MIMLLIFFDFVLQVYAFNTFRLFLTIKGIACVVFISLGKKDYGNAGLRHGLLLTVSIGVHD